MFIELDTNFIISCLKQGIDFASQLSDLGFEMLIPDSVITEMENLMQGNMKKKDKEVLKFGLELIKKDKIAIVHLNRAKSVDDAIVDYALVNNIAVATLDKSMKKRLQKSVPIVGIRGKKTLVRV